MNYYYRPIKINWFCAGIFLFVYFHPCHQYYPCYIFICKNTHFLAITYISGYQISYNISSKKIHKQQHKRCIIYIHNHFIREYILLTFIRIKGVINLLPYTCRMKCEYTHVRRCSFITFCGNYFKMKQKMCIHSLWNIFLG